MNLKFGKIINYNEKGFGFIKELTFSNESNLSKDIFFHISKMKRLDIENDLINLSKNINNLGSDIHIWFELEETKKGLAVKACWLDTEDIPKELLVSMVNEFSSKLKNETNSSKALMHDEDASSFTELFEVSLAQIKKGNEHKNLKELCEKYGSDPSNIRNDERMRHVCLNCGSESSEYKRVMKDPYKPVSEFIPHGYIKSPEGYHRCSSCQNKWYINYCWSCHTGRVDDRDPATPHCKECNWCKCSKCTSCSYYGCETTPYSGDNKYVDRIPKDIRENLDRI